MLTKVVEAGRTDRAGCTGRAGRTGRAVRSNKFANRFRPRLSPKHNLQIDYCGSRRDA